MLTSLSPLTPLGMSFKTLYSVRVLALAPTAYWKLNETSGTTAADSSGNGYNGTYSGPTLNSLAGAGPSMGYAPSFDGTNDGVNIYSSGLSSVFSRNEGTVSLWIYATTTQTNQRASVVFRNGTNAQNYWGMDHQANSCDPKATVRPSSGTYDTSFVTLTTSTWQHWAIKWSYSGNNAWIYRDGTAVATKGSYTNAGTSPAISVAYIGQTQFDYFLGYIHHVAYWNSALSDTAISVLATPS